MVQLVSEWAGRPLLMKIRRGKSGLHRTGWSVTPTGRKARESATESKPPRQRLGPRLFAGAVRVKRCGKSAPAAGATRLARQTPPGARPSRAPALRLRRRKGRSGPRSARVGCWRRRATGVLEKWPSTRAGQLDARGTEPGLQARSGTAFVEQASCRPSSASRSARRTPHAEREDYDPADWKPGPPLIPAPPTRRQSSAAAC